VGAQINGAAFAYMFDRAVQDLFQVSFFDRGKTSGLRPASLSHNTIALLLISASEQVVDQLVIDLRRS
jgi:hypothetical protein